jgi:hypothetical protein
MASTPCARHHRRRPNSGAPLIQACRHSRENGRRRYASGPENILRSGYRNCARIGSIRINKSGGVSDGPWRTSHYAGSRESSPYLRAYIAVHGLLALGREETIYYTAADDSEGQTLDGNCSYRVEGRDRPARWWSITAYGADDFLIPNPADRYSVSVNSVARRADDTFAVTLSKKQAEGDWIPVTERRFDQHDYARAARYLALARGCTTLPGLVVFDLRTIWARRMARSASPTMTCRRPTGRYLCSMPTPTIFMH